MSQLSEFGKLTTLFLGDLCARCLSCKRTESRWCWPTTKPPPASPAASSPRAGCSSTWPPPWARASTASRLWPTNWPSPSPPPPRASRPPPDPVPLLALCRRLPAVPLGTAVLGIADDGAPLLLRLPSPDVAHVLVAGTTGSGKTALAQAIVLSLALAHRRSQLQLVLIYPKAPPPPPAGRGPPAAAGCSSCPPPPGRGALSACWPACRICSSRSSSTSRRLLL